ncbi:hypothetical protein BT63DRAFT_459008 [Microthyrium microscopicum]|uniref:DNA/RNA-binding protein Alba-like domain-containing protein n=1 Tax=Microthyrium microscopicum TaxID=703497 RepID=A0A6A6U013_9PEZI|nr:hypothetical protein BT63DRAFT_459008 [Microthyrium microscopicum]
MSPSSLKLHYLSQAGYQYIVNFKHLTKQSTYVLPSIYEMARNSKTKHPPRASQHPKSTKSHKNRAKALSNQKPVIKSPDEVATNEAATTGATNTDRAAPDAPSTALDAREITRITTRQPGEVRGPPPPIPLHADEPARELFPPHSDDPVLRASHDLHSIVIKPSSKIENKVKQVLSALRLAKEQAIKDSQQQATQQTNTGENGNEEEQRSTQGRREVLVSIVGNAKASNKAISVAEVAKREFAQTVYQYTGVWTRLERQVARVKKDVTKEALDGGVMKDEDDNENSVFMDVPQRATVRNVACLVIYLALKPIPKLRDTYGEQVTKAPT